MNSKVMFERKYSTFNKLRYRRIGIFVVSKVNEYHEEGRMRNDERQLVICSYYPAPSEIILPHCGLARAYIGGESELF